MRRNFLIHSILLTCLVFTNRASAQKIDISKAEKERNSQWEGKHVAYLGDSMTDKRTTASTYLYWEYLEDLLGIKPYVYGVNGNQWDGIYRQAQKLHEQHPTDIDAIIIFAGTNDYNHGIPAGEFYKESGRKTTHNGVEVIRRFREAVTDSTTFCGRVNRVMSYLRENFPEQQIIIMTPIHRGYAKFSAKNEQPAENFANGQGLFIDDYVDLLKRAASIWSVPLIDLFSISGLYPLSPAQAKYFHNKENDLLHPNALGDYRLAKAIQYQLLALPSGFRKQ